jgi:hypothetical protein
MGTRAKRGAGRHIATGPTCHLVRMRARLEMVGLTSCDGISAASTRDAMTINPSTTRVSVSSQSGRYQTQSEARRLW